MASFSFVLATAIVPYVVEDGVNSRRSVLLPVSLGSDLLKTPREFMAVAWLRLVAPCGPWFIDPQHFAEVEQERQGGGILVIKSTSPVDVALKPLRLVHRQVQHP